MKNNFVSLKQVNIRLAQQIILQAVDVDIDQGQMVAIVGANGSGKTTLLKLLCGILRPNAGELLINNYSYSNSQQALMLRQLIGFSPDTPPLYALDTVQDYLYFVAGLKKIPKHNINACVTQILEVFALNEHRASYMHTLSKGVQQRINLAQAMIHTPQILIMDEPTNGLDADQCQNFLQFVTKLRQEHITIIIASHNYTDLIPMCDYMLKIAEGNIQKILLPTQATKVKVYDHADYTT